MWGLHLHHEEIVIVKKVLTTDFLIFAVQTVISVWQFRWQNMLFVLYKYNFVWSLFVKKVKYVCNFSGILWSRRRAISGKYSCGRILGSVWLSSSIYGSLGNNQTKPDLWFPICTGDNKIIGKWWPIVVPLSTWYIKWGLRNKNYLINNCSIKYSLQTFKISFAYCSIFIVKTHI